LLKNELEKFYKLIHPFETLDENDLEYLIKLTDIAYYRRSEQIIAKNSATNKLYLILKGRVIEYRDNDEVVSIYNEYESFDAKSLLYGSSESKFIVDEELICYELPKNLFLSLIEKYKTFRSYYVEGLAKKINSAKERERNSSMASFMLAKVSDLFLHKVAIVSPETSILDALKLKEEMKSSAIIVEDGLYRGIVTDTNLRNVILTGLDTAEPIKNIAVSPIKTIEHNDFLFNALLTFVKYQIKRVVILKNKEIVGILEQMDILSYFSNQSHLIAVQIERASTVEELMEISNGLVSIIKRFFESGVKVRHSSKLVNELNRKIYHKLALMIFPKDLHSEITIFTMGSEGRREQILKTDQDNGLIISRDEFRDEVSIYAKIFSEKLVLIGYPECDGNIMVSNPYWIETLAGYMRRISEHVLKPTPTALMELAIMFDSEAVFGKEDPLLEIREFIAHRLTDNLHSTNSFASATLQFETPISFFRSFLVDNKHGNELDIKKGGIFPIVHGIRSLAISNNILETNTVGRIKELNNREIFSREFALELIESFDFFLTLRLKTRLQKLALNKKVDNYIDPSKLSPLERELLKDSLKVVDKFKKLIKHKFQLDRL